MSTVAEKGGATFQGIKMLLCENPLPPIAEAIAAAQAEVPHSNYYTEPYSTPLRQLIAARLGVPERLIHINAGSELVLRQNFQRLGRPLSRSVPAPAGALFWPSRHDQGSTGFFPQAPAGYMQG